MTRKRFIKLLMAKGSSRAGYCIGEAAREYHLMSGDHAGRIFWRRGMACKRISGMGETSGDALDAAAGAAEKQITDDRIRMAQEA